MKLLLSSGFTDITPLKPVSLSGFAERSGLYREVLDKLEINLAVLKQGSNTMLIYSIDTLFVPEAFVKIVLDAYGKKYGFEEKDIWMVASHTHYAPSLDKEKPLLGRVDDEYYNMVQERLLALTEDVLNDSFKKVTIEYAKGTSTLNVNRRKKLIRPNGKLSVYNKVLMYPDYNGVKDDDIQLLRIVDERGDTAMILWNYACHPVGYPGMDKVTAEFPGYIRRQLRDYYSNSNLPIVFLIGFAGNLKPDITSVTKSRGRDKLNYFFQLGPKFVRFPDTDFYTQWVELLWKEVKSIIETLSPATVTGLHGTQYDLPLRQIVGQSDNSIHFKRVVLSDNFQLLGVSAEVLAEYKHVLEQSGVLSINVGCLAGTRIYLPTDEQVLEGGYEVDGFKDKFGMEGEFKKDIANKIKKAVSQL